MIATAFGLRLQVAVDLLPPDNGSLQFAGHVIACAAALGSYALAVRLREGVAGQPSSRSGRRCPALPSGRCWAWR
ncbi:MAG TPA: hypothetical protein VIT65_10935 [Microlunatus sp.]